MSSFNRNPNNNPSFIEKLNVEWKSYTEDGHNYLFFHLNNIHNELNYFDTMYNFWLECFRIENAGGCTKMKMNKHLTSFIILFVFLLIILIIYFIWKYFQKRNRRQLSSHGSPTVLLPYPNRVSA